MNDRCGCVRAHGYDLTGKMTGGGLRSVAWASAITLDSTSVIALPTNNKSRRIRGEWLSRFLDMLLVVLPCVLVMYRNRNRNLEVYRYPRPRDDDARIRYITSTHGIPQASCLRNGYAIPLGYAEIC